MSASPRQLHFADGSRPGAVNVAEELAGKGFTVRQLLQFYGTKGIGEFMTTGDVVKHIVIPDTAEFQTCYMDSPFMREHGGRQLATKLVTHAWRSRFSTTVINILLEASGLAWAELATLVLSPSGILDAALALRNLDKQVLAKTFWLCIFAVNQHFAICGACWDCNPQTSDEFAAKRCKCGRPKFNPCRCGALKYKPEDDQYEIDKFAGVVSFMKEGLVVTLDPELTALTRIWCVAEISEASRTTEVVFRAASGLDDDAQEKLRQRQELFPPVAECDASSSEDKRRILGEIGNQDDYNDFVWSYTELCFGACHRLAALSSAAKTRLSRLSQLEIQCSWNENMVSTSELELGSHFDILQGLRRLVVDISHLVMLTDFKSLAEGLATMKQLESLTLKFRGCKMLADVSPICASFANLQALQELDIQLPSGGVAQLGTSLAGLRALERLHLEDSPSVHVSSIAGAAPHLQSPHCLGGLSALCTSLTKLTSLHELTLSFKHCADLTELSRLGTVLNSLVFLRELSLDFEGCTGCACAVDLSMLGSSRAGLCHLRNLHLDWSSLALENLSALDSLARLQKLREVHLAFKQCSKLEDISALGACFAELKSLQALTLNFQACTKLVDLSELSRGLSHLHELRLVCLDFCGCDQLADVSVLGNTLVELQALQNIIVDFNDCKQIPFVLRRRFEDRAALSLLGREVPWESRSQTVPELERAASDTRENSGCLEDPRALLEVKQVRSTPTMPRGRALTDPVGSANLTPLAQEVLAGPPVTPPLACLPELRGRSRSPTPPPFCTPEAPAALPHLALPEGTVAWHLSARVNEALRRNSQLELRRAQLLRGFDYAQLEQLVQRNSELEDQVAELERREQACESEAERELAIEEWLRRQEDQGSTTRSATSAASPPFGGLFRV